MRLGLPRWAKLVINRGEFTGNTPYKRSPKIHVGVSPVFFSTPEIRGVMGSCYLQLVFWAHSCRVALAMDGPTVTSTSAPRNWIHLKSSVVPLHLSKSLVLEWCEDHDTMSLGFFNATPHFEDDSRGRYKLNTCGGVKTVKKTFGNKARPCKVRVRYHKRLKWWIADIIITSVISGVTDLWFID